MLCRGVQLSILLAAAVIPAACLRHETKMSSFNDESSATPLNGHSAFSSDNLMFWIACGAIPAMFSLLLGLTPTLLMVLAVTGQCLNMTLLILLDSRSPACCRSFVLDWRDLPAVSMALMTIVLPSLILWKPIDTSRASQLLFSARAKAALERGVDAELIPQSDASRLLVRVETPDGEVHVWRRSGYLFEFRRNGRMIGRVSSDTRLSPQPAEDVLPAIVPMVMHPEPNRILLLATTPEPVSAPAVVCPCNALWRFAAVKKSQLWPANSHGKQKKFLRLRISESPFDMTLHRRSLEQHRRHRLML